MFFQVLSSKMAIRYETKEEFSKPTKASKLLRSIISTICKGAPRSLDCLSFNGWVESILNPLLVARAMQLLSQLKETVLITSNCSPFSP